MKFGSRVSLALLASILAGCSHPPQPKVTFSATPPNPSQPRLSVATRVDRSKMPKPKLAQSDIDSIVKALQQFRQDCGRYPTVLEGLRPLIVAPKDLEDKWRGPYMQTIPLDPWGNPYVYQATAKGSDAIQVVSLGADGKAGGTDLKADVSRQLPN